MNKKRTAPNMEELLHREFARLPEPDPRRMAAIRQRVGAAIAPPPRRTHWFWWLAAGTLAAGVATAAFMAQRAEESATPRAAKPAPAANVQPPVYEAPPRSSSPAAEQERPSSRPDHRFGY